MKIIDAGYEILTNISEGGKQELEFIESAARVCYRSRRPKGDTTEAFIRRILKRNHESVLEHSQLTVKFIVDRGISHELVRHRLASYSQESTRYCNYSNERFDGELTFIKPCLFRCSGEDKVVQYGIWKLAMQYAEDCYFKMLDAGCTPQEARSVLPTSLKTEVVMTANYREWLHFFRVRAQVTAHPQMREVVVPLLAELRDKIPVIFDNVRCSYLPEENEIYS